jgi:hypothetical protein
MKTAQITIIETEDKTSIIYNKSGFDMKELLVHLKVFQKHIAEALVSELKPKPRCKNCGIICKGDYCSESCKEDVS